MRGASALQGLLDEIPSRPVRVFIAWEPVLATDVGPPSTLVLSQVKDARVEQWWDRQRLLSDRVLAAARAGAPAFAGFSGEQKAAWDLVGVYAPGTRWGDPVPSPVYCGNPVVDVIDSLRARLR